MTYQNGEAERALGELAALLRDFRDERRLPGSRRLKTLAGRGYELTFLAWPREPVEAVPIDGQGSVYRYHGVEGETVVSQVERDGRVVSVQATGPGPYMDETDDPLLSALMAARDVFGDTLADRPVDDDAVEALANRFPLPPLSKKAAVALEILRRLPPEQALTGPRLIDALSDHDDGVDTDQATLTGRIIPALRPYGVENIPRLGYRVAPHRR